MNGQLSGDASGDRLYIFDERRTTKGTSSLLPIGNTMRRPCSINSLLHS